MRDVYSYFIILFCVVWVVGCDTAVSRVPPTPIHAEQFAPQPTPTPIASIPSAVPTITPMPPLDSGWELLQTGLERRTIRLVDEAEQLTEQLYLLRIDPTLFRFEVAYSPGRPKSLPTWLTETEALIVVNGSFFTEAHLATGLVVVNGVTTGQSYGEFAGMFAVTGDEVEVRWLAERPYDPNEGLTYALQSFPMLVRPGGVIGFPEEDGEQARRTVVAQDSAGRLLFILAPFGSFTLHEMSQFLVASDLEIDAALNLDGGTSTGLMLAEPEESVLAFTAVPAVITIYPRE